MKNKKLFFIIVSLIFIFPFTAELWSASSPLILKHQGKFYFPVFKNYSPSEFRVEGQAVMTKNAFKELDSQFAVWPLNEWGPRDIDKRLEEFPSSPSSSHLFGTDSSGRDVLAISLYGLRIAYFFSLIVCLTTIALGYLIGGFFGFLGGSADLISQRMVETLSLIPGFFLILLTLSMFEGSLLLLIIISCSFGWIGISQLIRTETLKARKENYVEAALALGTSKGRLFAKHIIPNISLVVYTQLPFMFIANIVGLAVLDYLGMGISSEHPSIGGLIASGQSQLYSGWWIIFYPSMIITATLIFWVIIGERVRKKVLY